jgi:hypothetical protein
VTNSRLVYYWAKPDLVRREKKSVFKENLVKMNEKQSIVILKPPANSEMIRMGSLDSEAGEEAEASPVSNTLGTEPKQRS